MLLIAVVASAGDPLDDIERGRVDLKAGLTQPLAEAFDDVRRQLGFER